MVGAQRAQHREICVTVWKKTNDYYLRFQTNVRMP